ncbi:MAG: thioredoxin domain-containing protein [Pirellulaceae bacterium]|nr:thioredoxin domain-containing protein [Pirellulaceae bacterium]
MRKSSITDLNFELLETRRVLAGNVQAFVADGVLVVIGDSLDNQIEMNQDAGGNFVVTGNETTVNGSSQASIFPRSFRHVTLVMHGGNDEAVVTGLNVPSHFTFHGGTGNDSLKTHGLTAFHFHAEGQAGDDAFDLTQAISRSTYLYLGVGNDVVLAENVASGRNFKVFAHGGDDTFVANNLSVGRKFELSMDDGNDSVLLDGSFRAGRHTKINADAGEDFIALLPNIKGGRGSFGSQLAISAGSGNDNVAFDQGLVGSGSVRVNGDSGVDAIQRGGAGIGGSRITGFQSGSVQNLDLLIDAVMERLAEVGIGEVEQEFVPLSATATPSTLTIQENAGPTSVDPGISLQGSEVVTIATVSIGEYESGQERLTFNNTSAITGVFDTSSGIMTLSGTASTNTFQAAIRSVFYENDSESPLTTTRRMAITVFTVDETVTVSRDFRVIEVNDLPVIETSRDSVVVEPSSLPVIIDSEISISDRDDSTLTSAVISITSGLEAGDILIAPPVLNISAKYNPLTGVMKLNEDALVEEWQVLLRSISFSSDSSVVPEGTRTIEFVVSDGEDSNIASVQVSVQNEVVPNVFTVSESATNGTVLGAVTTEGNFEDLVLYQFNDANAPADILLNPDDHLIGANTAPIVLIDYQSYQCPACAASHTVLADVEDIFDDELMVVIRHQPLEQFLPNARAAAIVAEAAGRQGKFDEMTDQLMDNQTDWSPESDPTAKFEGYAVALGLDLTQFRNDVADPALDARVTRDRDEAEGLGIVSTPSFILQNEPFTNPGTVEGFEQAINEQLNALTNPVTLDRRTGELVLRDRSLLDSANSPEITLAILVKDSNGNEEIVTVTINVEP